MNLNISFKDSLVFVGSIVISALIIYPFVGLQGGMAWSSFAVLCTYSLYSAQPNKSNLVYIFCWLCLIMGSTYIGRFLHLSYYFYLYLFILTYCYYFFFGRDPVCDRAIRFIIILSTIGTNMPHITVGLPFGASVGTVTALLACHYMMRKHKDLEAFKTGIFTSQLFNMNVNIIPRAFVYSLGMFACLALPFYLGIDKNYWATLTFIMVMTPKAESVIHNTLLRFVGSVLAVTVLYFIFLLPEKHTILTIAFLFFSFTLPLSFGRSFTLVTFATTCYSLTLIEFVGYWHYPTETLLIDRIIETAIGGIIAIVISMILKAMRTPHQS